MTGIDDREFHKTRPLHRGSRPSIYELRKPEGADDLDVFFDEHLPLPPGGRVLDAGCGPGGYLAPAIARTGSVIALDIAQVRLREIDVAPPVCGDVQRLPFVNDSFDAILAMHMLYHVPDIASAASELRRVLRPGGVLYAFTNSERAQWELTELYLRSGGSESGTLGDRRFTNENGASLLRAAFDDITLIELTDTWLEVTDVECIVDELEGNRYIYDIDVSCSWDELIDRARRDAQAVIDREGAFVMHENHGLFICR